MTIIPTPWVMALVFVVFLFLVFTLNKMLYRPLLGFMDNRDASIKKDSEGIEGNATEIKTLKAQAQEVLRAARDEATAIKNKAHDAAKSTVEARINEKKSELAKKYNDFIAGLEADRAQVKAALSAQVPAFKASLSKKLEKL